MVGNLSQVSQIAVANAMASVCAAAGGCDFLVNTGDNFYDLGITGGVNDTQWGAFQNVYTKALFGNNTPFLGTLGNHDYSILSPTAAASQIAYTAVDPRWYLPDHKYSRVFTSASGAVSIQVVQVDSTPLTDRYLFSGASGGTFATDASGNDTIPNANAVNAVLNAGITPLNGWNASNGWTNGNVFNATNFQCGQCGAGNTPSQCGYNWATGKVLTATPTYAVPSGCKYASAEIAPLAHPAARNATWAYVNATLAAGYGANQYQIMFSHFPVLSAQQRLNPRYENATSTFSALGAAAPQIVYNGHDHIMAHLKNSTITTAGGQPISFITTGAAGISDYGKTLLPNGASALFNATTYPAAGYATFGDSTGAVQTLINAQYKAMPAAGVAASSAAYNPDVNNTQFWSEMNGFTLSTVNATYMRVDFYLVNCSAVMSTGNCSNVIGPINTQYFPAKNITSTIVTYVSAAYTLSGYSVATFNTAAATAFIAAVAADLTVNTSAVTITSVTAPPAGRHLLQSSVVVAFSVATPTSSAAAIATGILNGIAPSVLVANGLTNAVGVAVATAPALTSTVPAPVTISSSASTVRAATAALAAAVLALAL